MAKDVEERIKSMESMYRSFLEILDENESLNILNNDVIYALAENVVLHMHKERKKLVGNNAK